jgi:protein TonB
MFYAAIDKPELAMKDMDAAVEGAPANTYYLTGQAAPAWLTAPTLAQFYPQRALDANREGVAQLSCTMGAQGTLANCSVVSETPDGFGFGQAALKAAQDARLSPTTINGVPVDGRPIQFRSRFALR